MKYIIRNYRHNIRYYHVLSSKMTGLDIAGGYGFLHNIEKHLIWNTQNIK